MKKADCKEGGLTAIYNCSLLLFIATLYPYDNSTQLNCQGSLGVSLSQIVRLDTAIQIFCQQFSTLYVRNLSFF